MVLTSINSMMVSLLPMLNLLDFPLDAIDKMTLFLILFSAGLLCILCAILLAIYLLKSDRFTTPSQKETKITSYPAFKEYEEESRLSRLKNKIISLFRGIKGVFTRSEDDYELAEPKFLETTPDIPSDLPEEDSTSAKEDASPDT